MDQTKKKNERHAAKGFSYEECIAAMCPCNDLFFKQLMKNRELTNYMVRLITKEEISLVNIETE